MSQYLFYFLSVIAVISALLVVTAKNPIYSVIYLIFCFFAIAGQYILMNAQFLAVVHIIVYAGAIMVLFLFVLMMLNLNLEVEPRKPLLIRLAASLSGGLLLITLVSSLEGVETLNNYGIHDNQIGLVKNLGVVLFNDYLVPFEISSILFLAAMVGAVMLGKKTIK